MKTALFPCIAAMSATLLAACAPAAHKPAAPIAAPAKETAVSEDPYLWLEDIHGEKPLAWVETQNARTQADFADTPAFGKTREAILGILDSDAKIPFVSKIGDLPVQLNAKVVLLAAGFSICTGLFFGYYPARKASLLDPIEALRSQ